MKIDLKTGIIEINGEIIMPGYTFEDFRNTKFYKGQDGIRIIRINDTVQIGKNKFIASFFFRNKVLYMISIICVDVEIPFSEEIKRKNIHDNILKNNGNKNIKSQEKTDILSAVLILENYLKRVS